MSDYYRTPRNTARAMREDSAEALLMLAESMGPGGTGRTITSQEAAGQRELVNSDVIPTKGCDKDELTALGFKLGPVVEGDPLFRRTTLPSGWTREGSEHAMGSYLLDELGRKRVSIFYKAAFYDRSAHMSVMSVQGYVSGIAYEDKQIVLDGEWATKEAVLAAINELRAYDAEQVTFWTEHGNDEYVREHNERVAKWDALRKTIEASHG
jgi:hypothetical protein